jgi:FkbM family methyltransferase
VGSNIGDSSIYFALHGAERVFAIDPSPPILYNSKKK